MRRPTLKDLHNYRFHGANIGLGIQSTCMALMSINGDLPKPDFFIFADTGWERDGTLDNFERLRPLAEAAGIPFHVVQYRNIREAQFHLTKKGTELPYWINASRYETVEGLRNLLIKDIKKSYKKSQKALKTQNTLLHVPLETRLESALKDFDEKVERGEITDGWKQMDTAQLSRQCTSDYKIRPIQKFCRKHYNAHFKSPVGTWLGISTDEITRMAESPTKAFVNFYPLIDLRYSRDDCIQYLEDHDYPVPVKSACVGCPYSSDSTWREKSESEIQDAIDFEERANQSVVDFDLLKDKPYYANGIRLHRSMRPLSERPFEDGDSEEMERDAVCGAAGCFL